MAGARQGYGLRTPSGTQPIGALESESTVWGGPADMVFGQSAIVTAPATIFKAAAGVTPGMAHATTGRCFPYGGDNIFDLVTAANGITAQLDASGIPSGITISGLGLLAWDGPAMGDSRIIAQVNMTTRVVTFDRAWDAGRIPATGNQYRLFMPAEFRAYANAAAEYADGSGKAIVRPYVYSVGRSLPGATPVVAVRPKRTFLAERELFNAAFQQNDTVETNYYHGYPMQRFGVDGMIGWGLLLVSYDGTTLSLFTWTV